MRFSKDQKEGVAKVLDNIATAYLIAVTIGLIGVSATVKFDRIDGFWLCAFAIVLVFAAALLRFQKESEK
jgi:hypothetical protein